MTDHTAQSGGRFLVFGAPAIGNAETREAIASMKSGWLGAEPRGVRFESEFGAFMDLSHVSLSAGLRDEDVKDMVEVVRRALQR